MLLTFEPDGDITDTGVEVVAACVDTSDLYTNMFAWSETYLLPSGDCDNCECINLTN